MSIDPTETLITGSWERVNGQMREDSTLQRIRSLVGPGLAGGELEHIAVFRGGWERLYKDTRDGRYWELFFPHGEMQGGGPMSLRVLDRKNAEEKYGLSG